MGKVIMFPGATAVAEVPPKPAPPQYFARDEATQRIKAALKQRSGRQWSVTGGRGTAYGWIKIDAPPARCTWRHRLRGGEDIPRNYEEYDSGKPEGHMSPADRAELAKLLGLDNIHHQGVSIPAGSDYYEEYICRAEGRTPTRYGKQYWD